jgi:hypothetical protein
MPVIPNNGKKTTMTISVAKAIGRATSRAAVSARSRRSGAVVPPLRRCRMFSTMMIAASTSSPTAIASPPECHRVESNAEWFQKQARQRDRQRDCERHDQRRSQVADQCQDDESDEHATLHHRAANAAER